MDLILQTVLGAKEAAVALSNCEIKHSWDGHALEIKVNKHTEVAVSEKPFDHARIAAQTKGMEIELRQLQETPQFKFVTAACQDCPSY